MDDPLVSQGTLEAEIDTATSGNPESCGCPGLVQSEAVCLAVAGGELEDKAGLYCLRPEGGLAAWLQSLPRPGEEKLEENGLGLRILYLGMSLEVSLTRTAVLVWLLIAHREVMTI